MSQDPWALLLHLPVICMLLWRKHMGLTSPFCNLLCCKVGAQINHWRVLWGLCNSSVSTEHQGGGRPGEAVGLWPVHIVVHGHLSPCSSDPKSSAFSVTTPTACSCLDSPEKSQRHWECGHPAATWGREGLLINLHLYLKEIPIQSPNSKFFSLKLV